MNERHECEKHIDFLQNELTSTADNAIFTIDRGYPSIALFEKFVSCNIKFVARCSTASMPQIVNAPMGDSIVTLKNNMIVRVYKFELSTGEVETLATNLFDFDPNNLAELYAMRRGIETAYFRLKQELSIEKFSGKTPNAIRQDFWVTMVMMNAVTVFRHEADAEIEDRQRHKMPKLICTIARSVSPIRPFRHFERKPRPLNADIHNLKSRL